MEFITCRLQDLKQLQALSQLTYRQAFNETLGEENVDEYVNTTYSTASLSKELEDPHYRFLFIKRHNEIIGYGMYTVHSEYLKLDRVYILDQFKGLGAGSMFIQYVENQAQKMKKAFLCLEVLTDNKKAIRIYENKGFRFVSKVPITIGQRKCDLLVMKKKLV